MSASAHTLPKTSNSKKGYKRSPTRNAQKHKWEETKQRTIGNRGFIKKRQRNGCISYTTYYIAIKCIRRTQNNGNLVNNTLFPFLLCKELFASLSSFVCHSFILYLITWLKVIYIKKYMNQAKYHNSTVHTFLTYIYLKWWLYVLHTRAMMFTE